MIKISLFILNGIENQEELSYILKQGNGLSLEHTNVGVYLFLISGTLGILYCLGFIELFYFFFFGASAIDSCIFVGHFVSPHIYKFFFLLITFVYYGLVKDDFDIFGKTISYLYIYNFPF